MYGSKNIKFFDLQHEELWYFYIYSCASSLGSLTNSTEEIKFSMAVLNNGSHFGQN